MVARTLFSLSLMALLVSPACERSVTDTYVVHIDPALDQRYRDIITAAVGDWTEALDSTKELSLSIEVDRDSTCEMGEAPRIICVHPMIKWITQRYPSAVGITFWDDSTTSTDIFLSLPYLDKHSDQIAEQVVEHELGHSFGLEHQQRRVIMCPYVSCQSRAVTCADVQQYQSLRLGQQPAPGNACDPPPFGPQDVMEDPID